MKSLRKYLAFGLAFCLGVMPLSAAASTKTGNANDTISMQGIINNASTWNISIPDSISIDKATKTGTYEVSIYGSVLPVDIMEITPQYKTNFAFDWDDTTVTAKINQSKIVFVGSEIGTTPETAVKTTGTVVIQNAKIPAGDWNAGVEFNISVELEPGFYDADDNLVLGWKASGFNAEANRGTWDDYGKNFLAARPSIVKVVIPQGITRIGEKCFYGAENLKAIIIPPSCKTIAKDAFRNCYNLEYAKLYEGVTTLEDGAFCNSSSSAVNYKDFYLPSTVTSVSYPTLKEIKHVTWNKENPTVPGGADAVTGRQ